MNRGGPQFQSVVPFTPAVKTLVIANVGIWLVFQFILEQFFFRETRPITMYLGLVPYAVVENFFIWQLVTYMFLHSVDGITHILFNTLLLWWLGAELELRWGKKFFYLYYFVCGVGAAFIYVTGLLLYSAVSGRVEPLLIPVVGASGAIFGLMVAYGIIFGERIVYFMFLFPMKAKYFVMLLGAIEVLMMLSTGVGRGQVANLAHLGGLVVGFLFLVGWTRYQRSKSTRRSNKKRNLKLVVNNKPDENDPKYWN